MNRKWLFTAGVAFVLQGGVQVFAANPETPKPATPGPALIAPLPMLPDAPKSPVAEEKKGPPPLVVPLVEGFPSFGLRLPDLDEHGKLRSLFVIGSMSRVNDREVQLRDSLLESYADDGSREMSIELPDAILDRVTRVLVAHVPVTIRREQFEVTGATMEFNTLTREGGLGGPVRMLLYNLDVDAAESSKSDPEPGKVINP